MKPDKDTRDSFGELRERAEQAVERRVGGIHDVSALSQEEAHRLIHDLQVQQIELEMQNEELRSAQEELEESRDKYAELYNFAPVGYFTLDERAMIRQANLAGTRLLGLERAFLVDTPFVFFVSSPSRDAFQFHFRQVFESQATRTCEIEMTRKNGSTFHARLETSIARNSPGEPLKYQTLVSDISDLKRAEDALKTERDNLIHVMDSMPDGMCIQNRDLDIIYANSAMEKDFGPWRGRKCYEYFHEADDRCPSCMTDDVLAGKTLRWEASSLKTGKTYDLTHTPLRNADGTISKLAIMRDITDRKHMEDALRESEAKYRVLVESAREGIWAVDAEGRTSFANPRMAEILGYTADEMLGRSVSDFLTDEGKSRAEGYLERRREGKKEEADIAFVRKDGTTIYASLSASPIMDDEGMFKGSLACVSDISERKRAEDALLAAHDQLEKRVEERTKALTKANEKLYREVIERKMAEEEIQQLTEELEERVRERTSELEAANQELESFTYSVSHDLRAPLRSITGFSEIIGRRHRIDLNEEGRRYVDNIIKASHHMDRLIEDLLAYSRLGRHAHRREPVPLRPVFTQVLEDFADRVTRLSVEVILPKKLPTVIGDRTLLFQIFSNLINNALTYRRPNTIPRVTVSCERENDYVVVRVADNGIGISLECHGKIFNLFQRLHSHEDFPGSGIGLAIVKKSVQALRGRVWLESSVGQGTTFCVQLPVKSNTGTRIAREKPEASTSR